MGALLLTVTVFMKAFTHKKTQAAQVYFSIEQYEIIKHIAKEHHQGIATWIRSVVTKEIKKTGKKRKKLSEMPKFSYPGMDKNISENIDTIIYGNS